MNYYKCFLYIISASILGIIFFNLTKKEINTTILTSDYINNQPLDISNNLILRFKRTNFSSIVNNSATSPPPPGFNLVSSNTEYLFDYLGTAIQNLDFSSLAVKFGTCNLGSKSYVLITSIEDGQSQKLNAQTLNEWRNVSAWFNGEYVKIEVYQHDSESGISCPVEQLITSNQSHSQKNNNPPCSVGSVCGNNSTQDQDRIPSSHSAIARHWGGPLSTSTGYAGLITGTTGTAWLASNGAFVSAGHVVTGNDEFFSQVHFIIPSSTEDGVPIMPSPNNQYAIDFSSTARSYNQGNGDWAVFKVFPNPNTGLLPHEVQNSFLRVAKDEVPTSLGTSVTGYKYGYGIDLFPSGTCGGFNLYNRTLQRTPITHLYSNTSGTLYWDGVNEGGDSGAPIVTSKNSIEISAGNNNSCSGPFQNHGTSFYNSNFTNALNNIFGTNTEHVDNQHPATYEDGTITNPYKTIAEGVNDAVNNGTISIVSGFYNESITINKPLMLIASVGKVTIGADGGVFKIANIEIEKIKDFEENINGFMLFQNYPNPFNPSTTINYSVPTTSYVTIKIYNTLGQEVTTLVNEVKNKGQYSVLFDASQLSSGMYFYTLKVGDNEITKQMTLIK